MDLDVGVRAVMEKLSSGTSGLVSGKYAALCNALRQSTADLVVLSFDDLDELVDGLPKSARTHRAWWSNGTSHVQSRAWTAAGFTVREVDLDAEKVTFAR